MAALRTPWFVALLAALPWIGGCGGSGTAPRDEFQTLATFYHAYLAEHRAPPKNEAEFKQYIQAKGGKLLADNGIASVDALFISTRDGQPLKVVYAPDKTKYGQLVIFEQIGVEGQRKVSTNVGAGGLADEAEFRELSKPGGA